MGKVIQLKRIATSESGTYGVLLEDGVSPICITLERPLVLQEDGKTTPNISCIPVGIYEAHRRISPRFGETFEVRDVEEGHRTHILFHPGNRVSDSKGCLMPGSSYGHDCIEQSKMAFKEFMHRLREYAYFILQITEV